MPLPVTRRLSIHVATWRLDAGRWSIFLALSLQLSLRLTRLGPRVDVQSKTFRCQSATSKALQLGDHLLQAG